MQVIPLYGSDPDYFQGARAHAIFFSLSNQEKGLFEPWALALSRYVNLGPCQLRSVKVRGISLSADSFSLLAASLTSPNNSIQAPELCFNSELISLDPPVCVNFDLGVVRELCAVLESPHCCLTELGILGNGLEDKGMSMLCLAMAHGNTKGSETRSE
jgi:hypothetical protein